MTDVALANYVRLQPRIFAIAYRMLGSVTDADDVVQDTWLRWERVASSARSPDAMLVTIATRLSLDRVRDVQRRRDRHVGPWLPAPLLERPRESTPFEAAVDDSDPADRAVLRDSIGMAFLILLDRLNAKERATLILHDVFGYEHAEVAAMIEESVANSRQLLSRARRRLEEGSPARRGEGGPAPRPRTVSGPDVATTDTIARFVQATAAGDVATALALCSPDVSLVSDGGPHRHAARRIVVSPHRVTRLWTTISQRKERLDAEVSFGVANGDPVIITKNDGATYSVTGFQADASGLRWMWNVLDPTKISHFDAPARTWR